MPGSDSPQQDPGGLEITRGERARKGWGVGSGFVMTYMLLMQQFKLRIVA